MQLERQADFLTNERCVAIGGDGTQRRISGLNSECAISIDKRQLDPHIYTILQSVDFAKLDRIRLTGSAETVCQDIFRKLKVEIPMPSSLARWLCDDIDDLAREFGRLTGARTFLVRLEAITNDGCSRFHADNVRYRMVTTYFGPGTQWIAPPYAADVQHDMSFSSDAIRQLGAGWIALMRGKKVETKGIPGMLHRSPPMKGIDRPRLFLAIDDLGDHPLLVADNL